MTLSDTIEQLETLGTYDIDQALEKARNLLTEREREAVFIEEQIDRLEAGKRRLAVQEPHLRAGELPTANNDNGEAVNASAD